MTREGRVAGLTNSRRHRAEHGLCTLSVAFPKVDRTPPPPTQNGSISRSCFLVLPKDPAKSWGRVREGPTKGGYLLSPAVFLGPANHPHGSFCRAWKCADRLQMGPSPAAAPCLTAFAGCALSACCECKQGGEGGKGPSPGPQGRLAFRKGTHLVL